MCGLASLGEILLYSGRAEAELRAGRSDDRDIDWSGVKVDPLVDPPQPAVGVLQLPSLIVVFRKEANGRAEDEGDDERRPKNAEKSEPRHTSPLEPMSDAARRGKPARAVGRRRASVSAYAGIAHETRWPYVAIMPR